MLRKIIVISLLVLWTGLFQFELRAVKIPGCRQRAEEALNCGSTRRGATAAGEDGERRRIPYCRELRGARQVAQLTLPRDSLPGLLSLLGSLCFPRFLRFGSTSPPAQEAGGQEQHRPNQSEQRFDRDADQPQRQRNQPDHRQQHQCQKRHRPAQHQQYPPPDHNQQHLHISFLPKNPHHFL